jgi:hypothetical protein
MAVIRQFRFKLSDSEIQAKGKAILQRQRDRQRMIEDHGQVVAEVRRELKAVDDAIARMADEYEGGFEDRPIECREKVDLKRGVVSLVRQDTGEVVETRPMTLEERQEVLPLEEPKAEAQKAETPKAKRA